MSVLTPFLPEEDIDLMNSVLSSLSGLLTDEAALIYELEKSKYSDSSSAYQLDCKAQEDTMSGCIEEQQRGGGESKQREQVLRNQASLLVLPTE